MNKYTLATQKTLSELCVKHEATIEELTSERNELLAQVERLRGAVVSVRGVIGYGWEDGNGESLDGVVSFVDSVLSETTAQSLEAVKREAALERINAAMDYASTRFGCYDVAENYGDAILEFLKR